MSFELDDVLLAIDLETMNITDSIDVSACGSMLFSSSAILSKDAKRLFISNYGTGNVAVIDTTNKSVETVLHIKPAYSVAMAMSDDGSRIFIPAADGGLYNIDEQKLSSQKVSLPGLRFITVVPSKMRPNSIFAIVDKAGQKILLNYNVVENKIEKQSPLNVPERGEVRRIVISSDETRAYLGWVDRSAWTGTGNFSVFDLNNFSLVASNPTPNGVADFALNENTGKAYILGFSAGSTSESDTPIVEWDLPQSLITRNIKVRPSADQRAIVLDPKDSNYLYMTEGDPTNVLRKLEISSGKVVATTNFNRALIQPYAIIRDKNTGYIVSHQSPKRIFKLDLSIGELTGSISTPAGVGWGFYQGNLYVSITGDTIYSINPDTGQRINTYHIGTNINPGIFTVFGDKIATLDFGNSYPVAKRLLLLDAVNMTVLKAIDLPVDNGYDEKVIASPDGTKLYLTHGPLSIGKTTTIMILDANTLNTLNTIKVTVNRWPTGGTSGFVEADFDEDKGILYLAGHASVYMINMDTNQLLGLLDLVDAFGARGMGWSPSAVSGVVLSASKDKLFLTTTDAHSVFIYDLAKKAWSPQIINLRGYFTTDAVASPTREYLFTVNGRSDTITMFKLSTGEITKIISLGN